MTQMARSSTNGQPVRGPGAREPVVAKSDYNRLLRYSHIFASAVNELLESKLLKDICPEPLTVSQFHLLKLMSFNGQHQVCEVADFLGVSAPAATKNVDKLERLGLIIRERSTGDRRATLLSVSPKGRRLVSEYEVLKAARLYPVLEHFSAEEVETLSQLLERFSVSLFSMEDHDGVGFCLRCAAYLDSGCPVGTVRGGCPYRKIRRTPAKQNAAEGSS
jgi:DNA-binding MarR family transcriptional regulator